MTNEELLDVNGLAERLGVSSNTVRNYERRLKNTSKERYDATVVWDNEYSKGRGRKLYYLDGFRQFVEEVKAKHGQKKKSTTTNKAKPSRVKKKRNPSSRKKGSKKVEDAVKYTTPPNAKKSRVFDAESEEIQETIKSIQSIDEYEAVSIARKVSDLFLSNDLSVKDACKMAGVNSNIFWRIISTSEEATDIWDKAVAQKVTQSAVEMEYWVMRRLMDRLKTKKIKKEKVEYEYKLMIGEDGEAVNIPVEVSKVEVYEDFIPTASDIMAMRKMGLEIQLEAKKRGGNINGDMQYVSEKSEEQLRKEIEQYDRMIEELESGESKEQQ